MGTLPAGENITDTEALPAGYAEWFAVTLAGSSSSQVTLSLTGSSGIQFNVYPNCSESPVVASAVTSSVVITGAGTYYIQVDGTNSSVSGNYTLTAAAQ